MLSDIKINQREIGKRWFFDNFDTEIALQMQTLIWKVS